MSPSSPSAPRVGPDWCKLLWVGPARLKGKIHSRAAGTDHSLWIEFITPDFKEEVSFGYQLCEEQGRVRNWISDEVSDLLNQIILEPVYYFAPPIMYTNSSF